MPPAPTCPGAYIEEGPSGPRAITGVATSITAFIGRALRGPVNRPVSLQSFAEFTRVFGGLWQDDTTSYAMTYAVSHFFRHGGEHALIVRVFNGDISAGTATLRLATNSSSLVLEATGPGLLGKALRAIVDHETKDKADALLFNLTVEELDRPGGSRVVASESFRNVSVAPARRSFVDAVLKERSALVGVRASAPANESPTDTPEVTATCPDDADGSAITNVEILGDKGARTGIYALETADLFNLLCIPPLEADADLDNATWAAAAGYCRSRRAMLIIDPPSAWTANTSTAIASAESGVNALRTIIGNDDSCNAAAYFPRLRMPDPLFKNRLEDFAPCGAVAGIIARTDAQLGVWKAPAGTEASFSGVRGFTYTMTDVQNDVLNPVGLNCLRTFRVEGNVVWGARTLAAADVPASEWKYVPVRRLALFLEASLDRGTQWVVFEPNDEPLWAQIRLNVEAFMHGLFRAGAFQGANPRDAYFVKCDRETTTQNDINLGIVNIVVGFAPLKPAEFVIIKVQQMAGQAEG